MRFIILIVIATFMSGCSTENVGSGGSYKVVGFLNILSPVPIFEPNFKNDEFINNVLSEALENNRRGETSSWRNRTWKISGSFTPTGTYQRIEDKVFCRNILFTRRVYNRTKQDTITSCRIDEQWKLQGEVSYLKDNTKFER